MERLTKENAPKVSLIESIEHPEWGIGRFNYNSQPLFEGNLCSSFGEGCNSALLFDSDYHRWKVVRLFGEGGIAKT